MLEECNAGAYITHNSTHFRMKIKINLPLEPQNTLYYFFHIVVVLKTLTL